MAHYIVIKNFASLRHNGMETIGTTMELPESQTTKHLIRKGLIRPTYATKEDKRAVKIEKKQTELAVIKHDKGPMYFVLQGSRVIDRKRKKEAQELANKLNEPEK